MLPQLNFPGFIVHSLFAVKTASAQQSGKTVPEASGQFYLFRFS